MKRRLGVIGRADHGGLAAQTFAVAAHLQPDAALVLDMEGRGRGPFDPRRWFDALGHDRVRVAKFPFTDEDTGWLIERADVIFAAEGPPPGRDDFPSLCVSHGREFVIHVNPELWRPRYRDESTRLTLPTMWHVERFPDATYLPMPIDRSRFPFRLRSRAMTFLHVGAPAMCDRNGTDIVREAIWQIRSQVKVYVTGVVEKREDVRIGKVEAVFLPPVADHAALYPWDADVLVLPRRYGGQCLPMNEAASLGMPILTLDLPPQNERPGVVCIPPLPSPVHEAMIGGDELVYDADPAQLASAIDDLVRSPGTIEALSRDADRWAEEHSWPALLPLWQEVLGV